MSADPTTVWVVIGGLAVGTAALRASGPLMLRGRTLPPRLLAVVALVAPAILTGLILFQALTGSPDGIAFDARLVGLAVAAVAVWRKLPVGFVVVLAAASTALVRLLV